MVSQYDEIPIKRIDTGLGQLAIRHYIVLKENPTILFWHSLALDSKMWSEQFLAFKEDFSMVFIDAPGHGDSEDLNGQFSLSDCADSVITIMDHLSVSVCVIIGCSWGGMIAAVLPTLYPNRCIGSVAMNCTIREATKIENIQLRCVSAYSNLLSKKLDWLSVQLTLYLLGSSRLSESKEKQEELLRMVIKNRPKSLSWAAYSIASRTGYLSILKQVNSPILFIVGDQDREYTLNQVRESSLAAKYGEFQCIKQSGHISAFDSPEETNILLTNFFKKHNLVKMKTDKN